VQQPDTASVFGQQLRVSVFGQHEEGLSAFFSDGHVTLSGLVFGASQTLPDEQALLKGQTPAEPAPQEGELAPFDSTERAASAPAASNTRMKTTVLQLFQFPEPDEQQSPPEPDESLQLSSCCVFSSFISIFTLKTNVSSLLLHIN
jgi:hypothetical protein